MARSRSEVPEPARRIAARLAEAFANDQQLAIRLNEAQKRLMSANNDLWSGTHPEALALLYDDTEALGIRNQGQLQSKVTARMADAYRVSVERDDPKVYEAIETAVLLGIQEIHWAIRRAFVDYQEAAEQRRQLAADVGELVRELVDLLTAAGWSDERARNADVRELATGRTGYQR